MRFYSLETLELREDFWIFWKLHSQNGPLELRPEYKDLVCKKCKKLDVLGALRRGISPDVTRTRSDRDAVTSCDEVLVISAKARKVLESIPGVELSFFDFPSVPDRFAVYPTRIISAPPDGKVYTPIEPAAHGEAFQIRGRKCRKCGRFREVTFHFEWFEVPEDVVLAGVLIESPGVAMMTWVANEEVAQAIKESGLTGWSIEPQ